MDITKEQKLIDDICCQMQVLSHLKGLQSVLGMESFRSRFPELEGLAEKMTGRIKEQETLVREALGRYGLPVLTGTELIEGTKAENIDG